MKKFAKFLVYFFISFFLLFIIIGLIIYIFKLNVGTGSGPSMKPTLSDETLQMGTYSFTPKPGDIISFNCVADKCGDEYIIQKRIIKINNDGCFWVEGDNKEESFDSRDFGWLCPSEIQFLNKLIFFINL
jgi:signal peptidase I